MKKLLLCLFILISFFCSAQNPLVKMWDYRFGGDDYEEFFSLNQTQDGQFLIGGYSYSNISGDKTENSSGSNDYWIVKTDSFGNKLWDKKFGGYLSDIFSCLTVTVDGGCILGGRSNSDSSGDKSQNNWDNSHNTFDYWIVKLDSAGNKQWAKRYGGSDNEGLNCLDKTADHGYILGGYSNSDIGGDKTQQEWDTVGVPFHTSDYWVVKIDSNGNKEWDKRYGGTYQDILYSVHQTPDKGYILGGYSESDSSGDKTQDSWGNNDYWIVRIDELGNKLWDKRFGGTDLDELFNLQFTSDGGFILGGVSASDSSGDKIEHSLGSNDFWLVKVDSAGSKEWEKNLGGLGYESKFGSLELTPGHGYLISGSTFSNAGGDKSENNLGQCQSWIIKTDSLGNKEWDKTLLSFGYDDVRCKLIQTKDGCYAIANSTTSGIGGYKTQPSWNNTSDYWIVKFCDSTLTTNNETTEKENEQLLISPNPTEGKFTISSLPFESGRIEIYNILGGKIYSATFNQKQQTINIETFPSGIYFVKLGSAEKTFTQKLVVE
ncbi:MAG: T9SS type A sorting domain-containing protein [Bacteroidota bacterium]